MKLRLESKGFRLSPSLKSFATDKLSNLDRYYKDIQEVEVTLEIEVKSSKEVVNCMLNIRVQGKDEYIKTSSAIFEDAILKAADAAKRKLRTRKTLLQLAKKRKSPDRRVSAKKAMK